MMLASINSYWISLNRGVKIFLQQLRTSNRVCLIYKRRKHKRLSSSSFDFLKASSFVAMEVSSQFKQVFKVIDANGDGKISSLELTEVLFCLGYDKKSTATKEAEKIMREIDKNGDGFIDLDEFLLALNTSEGEICSEEQDYLMDAFLTFDADKNGLISAKELRRVLVSLGCHKCSLQECKNMIKGVDKDGDGFVNFQEFLVMMKGSES